MAPQHDLPRLEEERTHLYSNLASVGDFRPGTLMPVMRRCGKPNCACADPNHPGHGPQYTLTKKLSGKTVARRFPVGPEVDKAMRETANYKRFKGIVEEIVQVNEQICDAKPAAPAALPAAVEKGGPSPRRSGPKSAPQ